MGYSYFNRDISWLSFNYRVLLESGDISLPIYERIKFLSIHASNLEEFYKIRVAEHRGVIMKKVHSDEDPAEAEKTLEQIKIEVTRQQKEFFRIFNNEILPELANKNIILSMDGKLQPEHREFVKNYFTEEIFPFLQPVMLMKDDVKIFIRDNRLYQVVQLRKKDAKTRCYAIIKIPYAKIPRFIELPRLDGKYYFMFAEDVISANLPHVFVGYTVEGSYNIKISRDADIYIEEEKAGNIVETIKKKIKKRKIGDLSRFVYDRQMPQECLEYVCDTFQIFKEDLIPDNIHLNMEDLIKLPNPSGKELERKPLIPIRIPELDQADWVFPVIQKKDIFLFYPYHTFNYFIRFLMEASTNPRVEEIMVTQYRVAQDSEIITNLINAAKNGKKVTVFVEIKARFDEENNLYTAEMMQHAGIRILYSLPGLKVHAKVALVTEKTVAGKSGKSYAYLSTGNFNEKTARLYSDMAILTSNKKLTKEIYQLFDILKRQEKLIKFDRLLVTQFNMLPELKSFIHREIKHAKSHNKSHIILKMNGLQDPAMIDELYKASEAGVKIDLIIRGICCIVPNQPYSRNIHITRIVDMFLEHSRVWYFYNNGEENVYLTSADWMKRNLYRRIETAFPVLDNGIKQTIISILKIQLNDNVKSCIIDENLNNIPKKKDGSAPVHAQKDIYNLLANN
ncbi:MAG: polyphosphate kinase 1 [Dysgonamonadaceae bacterium]|jgi:polyphosphate kinase|nr:polyphosphate kinase 1 [Dysgonamonadaceae bacterium]